MNDYYVLYHIPTDKLLKTPEGRYRHTMKEIVKHCDKYAEEHPDEDISNTLVVLNAKDMLHSSKSHEEEEDYDY